MSWIWWLSIPPAATGLAIAWTAWSNRARRPQAPVDSVRAYEQFRHAVSRSLPVPPPSGPPKSLGPGS